MTPLTNYERHFLVLCADDYTGLEQALWDVEKAFPHDSPAIHREKTLKLIREMLEKGYIEAGDYPESGERWIPWSLSIDQIMKKINGEWDKLGKERADLIDVVSFIGTIEGNLVLEEGRPRNELSNP